MMPASIGSLYLDNGLDSGLLQHQRRPAAESPRPAQLRVCCDGVELQRHLILLAVELTERRGVMLAGVRLGAL